MGNSNSRSGYFFSLNPTTKSRLRTCGAPKSCASSSPSKIENPAKANSFLNALKARNASCTGGRGHFRKRKNPVQMPSLIPLILPHSSQEGSLARLASRRCGYSWRRPGKAARRSRQRVSSSLAVPQGVRERSLAVLSINLVSAHGRPDGSPHTLRIRLHSYQWLRSVRNPLP